MSDDGGGLVTIFVEFDGADKSATIFDQSSGELTLLNPANQTYLTLTGQAAKRMSPEEGIILKRGREFKIAGQDCINWSWMDETEMHTACLTPDGVLLRLVVDGQIVAEARSVFTPRNHPSFSRFRLGTSRPWRPRAVRLNKRQRDIGGDPGQRLHLELIRGRRYDVNDMKALLF